MLKITRRAGALALVLSIAACGTPAPTASTPAANPVSAAATDIATLAKGLAPVLANLPAALDSPAVQTITTAIGDIATQAKGPASLATAQAIANDVAALAPFANLIPPPYGQAIAAAATLAPVIVEEAGAVGTLAAGMAPAPGAMTPDQARAALRLAGAH